MGSAVNMLMYLARAQYYRVSRLENYEATVAELMVCAEELATFSDDAQRSSNASYTLRPRPASCGRTLCLRSRQHGFLGLRTPVGTTANR
jgi:hypothetical protein